MEGYKNVSQAQPVLSIAPRARTVNITGETPTEVYNGAIEVVHGNDGEAHIRVSRSSQKKYPANSRWNTKSIFLTINAEDLKHLVNL